jgi:hypothetical protein
MTLSYLTPFLVMVVIFVLTSLFMRKHGVPDHAGGCFLLCFWGFAGLSVIVLFIMTFCIDEEAERKEQKEKTEKFWSDYDRISCDKRFHELNLYDKCWKDAYYKDEWENGYGSYIERVPNGYMFVKIGTSRSNPTSTVFVPYEWND